MIIKDSAGRHYRVWETNDPDLQHVWNGYEVTQAKGHYIRKAGQRGRTCLVRKAATVVVTYEAKPLGEHSDDEILGRTVL